jgi:hypothetical protein
MPTPTNTAMFASTTTLTTQQLMKQLIPAIVAVVGITIPLIVMMVMVWRYSRGKRLIPRLTSKKPSRLEVDIEKGDMVGRRLGSGMSDSHDVPSVPLFCGMVFETKDRVEEAQTAEQQTAEVYRASMGMSLLSEVDSDGFVTIPLGPASVLM